jgi:N6-L-threonylcarbamoyladenine synthase
MLGLPYPGGPLVDKYAELGNPLRFTFPASEMKDYDFSFSGLKTSVLYFLQKEKQKDPDFIAHNLNDICASVQHTITKMLMKKLEKAADVYHIQHVGIAGGVSANSGLRKSITELGIKKGWQVYIPKFEYCTDNAAMIGITAYYKYLKGEFADYSITPTARASWQ